MSELNVNNNSIPILTKYILLWGMILLICICCIAFVFISGYSDYVSAKTDSDRSTHLTVDILSEYDPYVYQKHYLAVAESNGFSIHMTETTHAPIYEIVLEGEYVVNYYNGTKLVAKNRTAEDKDTIICNELDARKKVISVPDKAVELGYNKIVLLPRSGSIFSLCYFKELSSIEDSVVLLEPATHQVTCASSGNRKGSQYEVQGLFAFLADWNEDTINLQIESATSELNMQLIDVQNEMGTVLAAFPEHFILPKVDMDDYMKNDATLVEYSLPLIANTYVPYDVYVSYRYEDDTKIRIQKVNPFTQICDKIYQDTLIRTKDNIAEFSNIKVSDGCVSFFEDYVILDRAIFIPEGLKFVIKEGQTIDFRNNAFIISRSALHVEGTAENPVLITTTDDSIYSGIAVLEAVERSKCRYMICDNLGELSSGVYHLTGAVTFYESDVDFYDCKFLNNRSEDGLNTVRSDISLNNCTFKNTFQDAFDSDFCTGTFTGCHFEKTGNDAFDVSTSEFELIDMTYWNINDKAVSVGEASTVTIKVMYAQNVQTGIGAKDSSVVRASSVTVKDALIGFCSYQKKPEFGPCSVTVDGYSLEGAIDFKYIIQENDTLIVDGKQWVPSQKKKQALIIERMINEEPLR